MEGEADAGAAPLDTAHAMDQERAENVVLGEELARRIIAEELERAARSSDTEVSEQDYQERDDSAMRGRGRA